MGVHGLPCRFAIRGQRLPAAARSIGEKAGFPESFATRIQMLGLHLFVAFSQQGRKFAGTQLAVKNRRAIFVDSGVGDDLRGVRRMSATTADVGCLSVSAGTPGCIPEFDAACDGSCCTPAPSLREW